jgi:hypothetical protein
LLLRASSSRSNSNSSWCFRKNITSGGLYFSCGKGGCSSSSTNSSSSSSKNKSLPVVLKKVYSEYPLFSTNVPNFLIELRLMTSAVQSDATKHNTLCSAQRITHTPTASRIRALPLCSHCARASRDFPHTDPRSCTLNIYNEGKKERGNKRFSKRVIY